MIALSLTMIQFEVPFAPPIASVGGSRLRWWEWVRASNLTVKSWLVTRYAS
jgi:hypothetical protein